MPLNWPRRARTSAERVLRVSARGRDSRDNHRVGPALGPSLRRRPPADTGIARQLYVECDGIRPPLVNWGRNGPLHREAAPQQLRELALAVRDVRGALRTLAHAVLERHPARPETAVFGN